MLLCAAMAALTAGSAQAAQYKMVACAGNNGAPPFATATNTPSANNPHGIFDYGNWCGGNGGDPPGSAAHLRIVENQAAGNAGHGAYGQMIFDTPHYVHFKAAGGYTRQPNSFNDGWRSRFWVIDFYGAATQLMTQGSGLPNSGGQWATSGVFGPHLWPFGSYMDFWRFVFELQCVRPAGCDRANYNATDLNGIVFVLNDDQDSQVGFTAAAAPLLAGSWVRGTHNVTFEVGDRGSGLRWERIRIDGNLRWAFDHALACDTSYSQTNGEWARSYQPCPTGGPIGRTVALDTATLSDGAHVLSICTQDYGQYQGLNGTGSESCDQRTIRVDNTAPDAPSGLHVTSANPHRYLDRFGAQFSLPTNSGSPIAKVHYNVVNAAGEVVRPLQTISATNPTEIAEVEGPAAAGDYRLRVWLEDQVGHVGPAATVAIPRDTTPPAAPQGVSVTPPEVSRTAQGFDVRWHNIVDAGSPITEAHYQVLNRSGGVVVPTKTLGASSVASIEGLETPLDRGSFVLRLWLSDAEGNVGAPVSAPLSYDCVRSEVTGGLRLSAGLGARGDESAIVREGEGSSLAGTLQGVGGPTEGAPLCIYSNVITDAEREFLGIAVTGRGGTYRFSVPPGPSRQLGAIYRPDQRQLTASATLQTRVSPTFSLHRSTVRNKHLAHFFGRIPGPHNDRVVVVLQVKSGKGWRAFRRYRTREGGRFTMRYRFTQTASPTTYVMRAQVRNTVGYPYVQGNSRLRELRVLP